MFVVVETVLIFGVPRDGASDSNVKPDPEQLRAAQLRPQKKTSLENMSND
jgi:hypothetical protein